MGNIDDERINAERLRRSGMRIKKSDSLGNDATAQNGREKKLDKKEYLRAPSLAGNRERKREKYQERGEMRGEKHQRVIEQKTPVRKPEHKLKKGTIELVHKTSDERMPPTTFYLTTYFSLAPHIRKQAHIAGTLNGFRKSPLMLRANAGMLGIDDLRLTRNETPKKADFLIVNRLHIL